VVAFSQVHPRGMLRRSATAAAGVALALGFADCVSTSMSAAEVRVPVLFGAVPCIGCTAASQAPSAAPVSHVASGDAVRGILLFLITPVGIVPTSAGESESLGISLDRLLYWARCGNDIRLSNLRVRAWQATVPIFYFQYEVAIEAEAAEMTVTRQPCL
jgi:hypothetical protein